MQEEHPAAGASTSALVAEFVGTAFLLIGVVGSGIMAERLSEDVGLQLLENSIATGGILVALILAFASASGAHFNPAVSLFERLHGNLSTPALAQYIAAQVAGGFVGTVCANVMFELDPVHLSTKDRSSVALVFSEVIATIGLLIVIAGVVRSGQGRFVAFAVGGYIGGAYWFTSSTSFANPAVTFARMFSDSFAGIEPASAPAFIAAQIVGALLAVGIIRLTHPPG